MDLRVVVALSATVQLAAAIVALTLIPLTEKRLSWCLIALALFLMTLRRALSLFVLLADGGAATLSPVQEYIGLALSLCMLPGIALIRPIFAERKQIERELQQQATTDELTGVANRRRFFEAAQTEIKRSLRHDEPLAVVFIDIDFLKDVNDTYGHATGDRALTVFSNVCRRCIREIDMLARIGGDEFALLLPETSLEQAYATIERVRVALRGEPIGLDGHSAPVSISAGVAAFAGGRETLDALLSRADRALYEAKGAGRARTVIDERTDPPPGPQGRSTV